MRNIQFVGLLMVIVGSFLPLVHIPIIGNWDLWHLDNRLAMFCYLIFALILAAFATKKKNWVKILGILLLFLFIFTIISVRYQALDFFSFLPFKSWKNGAVDLVKLKWGWILEFAGVLLIIIPKHKNNY